MPGKLQFLYENLKKNVIATKTQYSPFIILYLGSIGMDRVISEPCYKETILQRNYRKMTIKW